MLLSMSLDSDLRPLTAESALRIASPARTCAFGPEGVDLPAQVRRRVKESLTHEPLFLQASRLIRQNKFAEGEALLRQCLTQGTEEDFKDPRYFGVFWQHGQAMKALAGEHADWVSLETAIQRLSEAIVRYPGQARSAHYVAVAELIAEHRPLSGSSDAAAILQRGMQALSERDGRLSERLREMFAGSELPRTKEYRPQPMHVRVLSTSRGVDGTANMARGHGQDWLSLLIEADAKAAEEL